MSKLFQILIIEDLFFFVCITDANESPVQHCRTCSSPLEEVSGMEVYLQGFVFFLNINFPFAIISQPWEWDGASD